MVLLSYKDRVPAGVTLSLTLRCVLTWFYTNPPINDRVWSQGKKSDVVANRLLVQRAKFASHIRASAGVFFGRRDGYTLSKKKQRLTPVITLTICFRSWWKMIMPCWETVLYLSRMVHRHMGRCERKSGLVNIMLYKVYFTKNGSIEVKENARLRQLYK